MAWRPAAQGGGGAAAPPPPVPPAVATAAAAMLLLPLLQAGRDCPPCFCFSTPDTVQCRYVRLLEPPAELPSAVHNLSIVGGNLTVLRGAAFAGGWAPTGEAARPLEQLELLLLAHDGIEALEDAAFAGLPALRTLDLSHNPLRALPHAAFAACCARLRTLRLNGALLAAPPDELLGAGALANLSLLRLELAGNRLGALPPPAPSLPAALEELDVRNNSLRALGAEELLDGLAAQRGLQRLQLAGNPLRCDCASLRPLLSWMRNNGTAGVPDRRALRCASPAPLRDRPVLRLRPGQLDCLQGDGADTGTTPPPPWDLLEAGGGAGGGEAPSGFDGSGDEEELETASYVFFGIVLALIGLVFLMVLYLNRKGIKRWLSNLREACRDQMEGYHYRYEQDSDPRRAGPGGDL